MDRVSPAAPGAQPVRHGWRLLGASRNRIGQHSGSATAIRGRCFASSAIQPALKTRQIDRDGPARAGCQRVRLPLALPCFHRLTSFAPRRATTRKAPANFPPNKANHAVVGWLARVGPRSRTWAPPARRRRQLVVRRQVAACGARVASVWRVPASGQSMMMTSYAGHTSSSVFLTMHFSPNQSHHRRLKNPCGGSSGIDSVVTFGGRAVMKTQSPATRQAGPRNERHAGLPGQ